MTSNRKICQGKDVFERMNYLYQASHLMALKLKNRAAASYYANLMIGCGRKAVLRMSTDVKRTICKSCRSPLIPGETARVRLVSKPAKLIKWTCLVCRAVKKFPTKLGYELWSDQPESLVECFHYAPQEQTAVSEKVEEMQTDSTVADGSNTVEAATYAERVPREEDWDNVHL